jgi:predicted lipid-binding transport protein (Tim44 family)
VVVRPSWRRDWLGPIVGLGVGLVAGRLVSDLLQGRGSGLGIHALVLVVAGVVATAWIVLRGATRPRTPAPVTTVPAVPVAAVQEPAAAETELERGVRQIRRTDRGFDPARFAGYAGTTLRDVLSARTARTADPLRDRLTPAMYAELQARDDRLRADGRSARFAGVDVDPEVTEAWQEGERDYVTACVTGSMLSHTIDDATGAVVAGSPTIATPVRAFLTFTRPAGLNFWMLSVIQEEGGSGLAGA